MLQIVLLSLLFFGVKSTPTELLKVLQKSSASLGGACNNQIQVLSANYSLDGSSWALRMMDITAKVPFSLDLNDMGDFQRCIKVEEGKYCLGHVEDKRTWALCLPNSCSTADANAIFQAVLPSFSDLVCQTAEDVNPKFTTEAKATLCFLAVLLLIVLFSTFWDICNPNSCPLVINGFSVYSNAQQVFKMDTSTPNQLPCLNGLKFLSTMWVVATHQFSTLLSGTIGNFDHVVQWTDSLRSMFIISGNLAVDTFLTISGTVMVYGFMRARTKGTSFNILSYYFHRYLRLTPSLAVVVLVSSTLLQYLGSGPQWPLFVRYFEDNCRNYWWSALLYTQNYVNVSNMCVGQTWYLDVDMQLYLISPVIFFAIWKKPKLCLCFLGVCSLGSVGTSFHVAWTNELPAIWSNFYSTRAMDYQNKYYLLTHTRAVPWIFGVVLGYLIFKIRQNEVQFKLNKTVVGTMWTLCLGTLLSCVLIGHGTLRSPDYNQWGNALHIALVRPIWSLAIAWIILACTMDYGGPINRVLSFPIYQVLNKFAYGIYLTHVTLLYAAVYSRKSTDYFSEFDMAYRFCGTLGFSAVLAAILVFMVERPMMVVEKILTQWFVSSNWKRLSLRQATFLRSLSKKLRPSESTFRCKSE